MISPKTKTVLVADSTRYLLKQGVQSYKSIPRDWRLVGDVFVPTHFVCNAGTSLDGLEKPVSNQPSNTVLAAAELF